MSDRREVVVRPAHRDEPELHRLAEAMIRLVVEESGGRGSSVGLHSRRPRFAFHSLARAARTLLAGDADELNVLAKQRDKLEDEQRELIQAHDVGAVPLPVLKKEQSRIDAEPDHLNVRLERHPGEYADAKSVLTRCLALLDNLAGLYARRDDLTRRLCNRALFTTPYVADDQTLRPGHTQPFELLLDLEAQASALTWAKTAKN